MTESGLLTDGSSYSPTPSRRKIHQGLTSLAFVPDHSNTSVKELHPLLANSAARAISRAKPQKISHLGRQMSKQFCRADGAMQSMGKLPKVPQNLYRHERHGLRWAAYLG